MKFREYLKVINFYKANKFWFTRKLYNFVYRKEITASIIYFETHPNHYSSIHRRMKCIGAKRAGQFIDASNQPSNKSDKLVRAVYAKSQISSSHN